MILMATALHEVVNLQPNERNDLFQRIEELEQIGEDIARQINLELSRNFITPFDREDIYTLGMALDDICDYMDAAGRAVVMYNVHESDAHAIKLAIIIQKLVEEVFQAIQLLQKGIRYPERAFRHRHEGSTHQIDDCQNFLTYRNLRNTASGSAFGIIRRTDQARFIVDEIKNFPLIPGVIPQRNTIDAQII